MLETQDYAGTESVFTVVTAIKSGLFSATIHSDIKRTLVSMLKRIGMTISQVTDEVLFTGLIEMQS